MPPLLQRLSERQPEQLDYLGVSYGLTPPLLRYSGWTCTLNTCFNLFCQILETSRFHTLVYTANYE